MLNKHCASYWLRMKPNHNTVTTAISDETRFASRAPSLFPSSSLPEGESCLPTITRNGGWREKEKKEKKSRYEQRRWPLWPPSGQAQETRMQKRNFGSLKATHRSMLFHRSKAPLSVPSFYLYMLLQSSSVFALLACKGFAKKLPSSQYFCKYYACIHVI